MSTSRRPNQQMLKCGCLANNKSRVKFLSSLTKGTKPQEIQLFEVFDHVSGT